MAHILNQYFDRIFVITCADFHDRHEHIRQQLKGIEFEWHISPPADKVIKFPKRTATETSLILGSYALFVKAKLHGYKKIVLMEDDIVLNASEDQMRPFLEEVTENWGYLYMGNPVWAMNVPEWSLWDKWTTRYSEHVNRIAWGNGGTFLGFQSHVYDETMETIMTGEEPNDFAYYRLFQKYKNAYCPSKGWFADTISEPHESVREKSANWGKFLPSRNNHSF